MAYLLRGELSAMAGVHAETLRYYENIGLIPAPAKNGSGYRTYPEEIVGRLSLIKMAKNCGYTLEEIKSMFYLIEHCDNPDMDTNPIIDKKIDELNQKINEMKHMIDMLQIVKTQLGREGCTSVYTLLEIVDKSVDKNILTL